MIEEEIINWHIFKFSVSFLACIVAAACGLLAIAKSTKVQRPTDRYSLEMFGWISSIVGAVFGVVMFLEMMKGYVAPSVILKEHRYEVEQPTETVTADSR